MSISHASEQNYIPEDTQLTSKQIQRSFEKGLSDIYDQTRREQEEKIFVLFRKYRAERTS